MLNKMLKVLLVCVMFTTLGFSFVSPALAQDNNAKGVKFEFSEIKQYDVTFKNIEEKKNGKIKVKGLNGRFKGEYAFSENTITVEMEDKDILKLAKDKNVVSIEPDMLVEPEAYYPGPYDSRAWTISSHNSDEAYYRSNSGQGVKVAVLDSGVDTNNPYLTHAIKGGHSVESWSNGSYEDITGHGTMVAGSLAAKDGNGKPYGLAPDVDLYAVLITMSAASGSATISSMARGIEWAILNDMDVINISFGGNGVLSSYTRASDVAKDSQILIAHGAGNNEEDRDSIPGRCGVVGTYCIAAITSSNDISYFSASGYNNIAFGAGGSSVPVAINDGSISIGSGTSMASPNFAALYSLIKSEQPAASVNQIINHMVNTANDIPTSRPIGNGKAMYSPLTFSSSDEVLETWNYYYPESNTLSFSAYEKLYDKTLVRVSYELWEVSGETTESFVKLMGTKTNVKSWDSSMNHTITLDPTKKYLIKSIVDFEDGTRQWQYDIVNNFNYN